MFRHVSRGSFSKLRVCGRGQPPAALTGARQRHLHVINSLTRQSEPIALGLHQNDPWISWYACGPTVYADAHIGHARTYVALDILRRATEALTGKPVLYQMGITDVDDKILAAAAAAGTDAATFASHFERRFMADMAALGVLPPTVCTRVTEHIDAIVAYVVRIIKAGFAYVAGDGVYFRVAAMGGEAYGKLRPSAGHGDGAAPVEEDSDAVAQAPGPEYAASAAGSGIPPTKVDRRDFALWKLSRPAAPGSSFSGSSSSSSSSGSSSSDSSSSTQAVLDWPSPWGRGRPGWHIECSAMTHAVLGPRLHVHAGGIDLAFPHHCNEIAQAEAHNGLASLACSSDSGAVADSGSRADAHAHAGGCCSADGAAALAAAGHSSTGNTPTHSRWVSTWLHTGHVHIDGRKMSKSLKNFITVRAMLGQLARPGTGTAGATTGAVDASAGSSSVGAADAAGSADAVASRGAGAQTGVTGDGSAAAAASSSSSAAFAAGGDADGDAATLALRELSPAAITAAGDAFRWFVASHRYREAVTYSSGRLQYAATQAAKRREFLCAAVPRALAAAAAAAGSPGAAPTLWREHLEGSLLQQVGSELGTGVPPARLAAAPDSDAAPSTGSSGFGDAADLAAAAAVKGATAPSSSSSSSSSSRRRESSSSFEAALRDDFDVPGALKTLARAEEGLAAYLRHAAPLPTPSQSSSSLSSSAGSAEAAGGSAVVNSSGEGSKPSASAPAQGINAGVALAAATAIARGYALLGFTFAAEALAALQPPLPGVAALTAGGAGGAGAGAGAGAGLLAVHPFAPRSKLSALLAQLASPDAAEGKASLALSAAGAAQHAKALAQAEADAEAAVRALVAVRSAARAAAVGLSKAAKQAAKEGATAAAATSSAATAGGANSGPQASGSLPSAVKEQAAALMAACDDVRDSTLPALGWRLKDSKDGSPALERAPRAPGPLA